jgi:asparagine synthase (glutamine-hydrolysing)
VRRTRIVPAGWSRRQWVAAAYRDRVEQVRWAVVGAVERQLLADVPVGLFLSGGVDSSILAAVAAAREPNLTSFSIRPGETLADLGAQQDAELAAVLARSLGIRHCELVVEPGDLLNDLDDLLARIDEPVAELYVAAEVLLSRLARRTGVPVVLTGHGGDEVFMGYPTYQAVRRGDRYDRIPWFGTALRGLARIPWLPSATRDNARGAADVWRKPPLARYATVSAVHFTPEEVAAIVDLPLASVHELVTNILDDARAAVADLPANRPLMAAELFARLDLRLKVPEHYNMRLDRATMTASIEARVPFQDLDLIGFVMQLSSDDLLRRGTKGLLKDAFADVVPAAVRQRPKQTFQAPMLSWLRGPLGPWVRAQIARLPRPLGKAIVKTAVPPCSTWQAYRAWGLALLASWRDSNQLEY